MHAPNPNNRTTLNGRLELFRSLFAGLEYVYGARDPRTGRAWQVKEPVTDRVLEDYLEGRQHFGVYLLVEDRTRALVVDFDTQDLWPAHQFVGRARHYDLPAYVERSKSKGHHVWLFFPKAGVPAAKARCVALHILDEIGCRDTEVFPKQDRLDRHVAYGNFIFAPLFGGLVPHGRTVFMRPVDLTQPVANQWNFLRSIERISEGRLDALIGINDLAPSMEPSKLATGRVEPLASTRGLPPCGCRMLVEGVRRNQRVSCFRLAVQLKGTGLPYEHALAVLYEWARRIRPADGKRIITPLEIQEQASCAFAPKYRGYGCDDAAVQPFCDSRCPVRHKGTSRAFLEQQPPDPSERSTTMSNAVTNRPFKEFRVRGLSVAIWQNDSTTRDGQPTKLHSITLNKRYRDQQTGEWKDSSSFFPDDLPRLRLLIDKAFEQIMLRENGERDSESAPSDTIAADERAH